MTSAVYTLGHSTHTIDKFVALLRQHHVTAIADVRSRPFSRMNPHFSREPLKSSLKAHGIAYAFLGQELGARPEDPSCYVQGRASYTLIARTPLFHRGLDRVIRGTATYRIALVCAEKDPMTCHRAMLVCRALAERDVAASHILANGDIEPHVDGIRRVAREVGVSLTDLFRPEADLLAEAYARRIADIEYVEAAQEAEQA